MIYRLLGKLLYSDSDISSRVGTRIYFENAPANETIPPSQRGECIIIRLLSGEVHVHVRNECDIAERIVQIDFYAENATTAESGFELVRNRLSGFGPEVVEDVLKADGTEVDVAVSAINLIRPGMFVNAPVDGTDKWTKRFTGDFQVFHSQDVPTHA